MLSIYHVGLNSPLFSVIGIGGKENGECPGKVLFTVGKHTEFKVSWSHIDSRPMGSRTPTVPQSRDHEFISLTAHRVLWAGFIQRGLGSQDNIWILSFPISIMPYVKMTLNRHHFTKSNQVGWVEFQVGMEMKRLNVMNLKRLGCSAGSTGWMCC